MPEIKAILFDLDDTLWPIMPAIERAERDMFDWLGLHAPEVARQFSISSMRARRIELAKANPRYRFDVAALRHAVLLEAFTHCNEDCANAEHAMAVFAKARNTVDMFDDVHPGLQRLSCQWLLGTVTNGPADLAAIGIAHHFRTAVAAHRFGSAKPDPAIFHAACRELGVEPGHAVYVGDDPVLDVEGAQRAGLKAVWLKRPSLWAGREAPAHIEADAICSNLGELENWLGGGESGLSGTRPRRSIE